MEGEQEMSQDNNQKNSKSIKSIFTRTTSSDKGSNSRPNWGKKPNNTSPKNKK